MSERILSLLDEAMIIGYFAATGIKDKDDKNSIRASLEEGLREIEDTYSKAIPCPVSTEDAKSWRKDLRLLKRDYLARREARVLHENRNAVERTVARLDEDKNPWNIHAAEKARTHILYHAKMAGYGNAIIYNIPPALKNELDTNLSPEMVRSDALYAMIYSLFSETDFVEDIALSLSERRIKQHLAHEKENFQALLDDPNAFLSKIAAMIREETMPPELPETDMHQDEEEENSNKQQHQDNNAADGEAENAQQTQEQNPAESDSDSDEKASADQKYEVSIGHMDETEITQEPALGQHEFDTDETLPEPEKWKKQDIYKVYTTKYDEIVRPDELADPAELERLYETLQSHCEARPEGWRQPNIKSALATRIHTNLERRQKDGGHIDPATLSQIAASGFKGETAPEDIYLRWKNESEPDTCITLLLDCSGSMRGAPIAYVAQFAEIFGDMMARSGVPFEILGFTTTQWKGGKSREDWLAAGRPAMPGRLSDLRHVIYKDMTKPWKRERHNLGLLLKDSMLKENIDGEALEWAFQRSLRKPARRRIIIPISDGCPVDDSTLVTNNTAYLENHLHEIISKIEKSGQAELHAIGIGGYNTSRFYRNNYSMTHTENPYIAASEILESIARFAPGQEHKLKSRLRMKRARDAEKGRLTGRGAGRLSFKSYL